MKKFLHILMLVSIALSMSVSTGMARSTMGNTRSVHQFADELSKPTLFSEISNITSAYIVVTKIVDPVQIPEPGGEVTFTIMIVNEGGAAIPVTITSLVDSIYGDLNGQGSCVIPQVIEYGEDYTCQFSAVVTGNAGYSETDIATALGIDDDGNQVFCFDDATVTIIPLDPMIDVVKTADPTTVVEPGGNVTFTVDVTNLSGPTDPVTINSLVDDIHGDLNGQGTCAVPFTLQPGETYTCEFTALVEGEAGDSETDIVTASGVDDEETPVSDWDDATVVILPDDGLPEIDVVKTADPVTVYEPGGDVVFTVEVTNLSSPTDPVTITSLVDDIHGDLNGQGTCSVPQVIQPGAIYTCQFTALVEGNAGYVEIDTVTASGTDDEGFPVSDFDDAMVTVLDVLPSVDLVKDVTPSSLPEPGGDFLFTLTIYNTSPEPVIITELVDDNPLPEACTDLIGQTLPVGGSALCNYTVTHTDVGTYLNTASMTVEDDDGNPASDTDNETVTVTNLVPAIEVVKTADPESLPEPGGVVTFTVEVTNLSNPSDPVTITSLVDDVHGDLDGQGTCAVPFTLQFEETYTCQFTALVEGDPGDSETDIVTATGTDDDGTPVSDSDDATVTITPLDPLIEVVKTADPVEVPEPGAEVTFTVEVSNLSNPSDPVTITSLVDDIYGDLDGQGTCEVPFTLLPGETYTCQFTALVQGDPGDSETDTVTATGTDDDGTPVSDSDDATVTITPLDPEIEVIKIADPTVVVEPGGVVTFTVEVTNLSNPSDPVTITSLVDDIHGDLDGQGTCAVPFTLQPGETYTCQFSALVEGEAGESEKDTVTATGKDDEDTPVSGSDDATVTIVVDDGFPEIEVIKTADPTTVIEPGGVVTFTVEVTNLSSPTDPVTIDSLVDDIHGDLDGQGTCAVPFTLQPGETYTCQFTALVQGEAGDSETDTVTASGTDDEGLPVSDSDDATVVIESSISVYKLYLPTIGRVNAVSNVVPLTLGFEDLDFDRPDMDFDYNDWVTNVDTNLVVDRENQNLYRISFQITPRARGGVRTHAFHILIPADTFASNGYATLITRDGNGSVVSYQQTPYVASQASDFVVIPCTCDAFPEAGEIINAKEGTPLALTQRTVQLIIEFSSPAPFEQDYLSESKLSQPHGEGLFFDPYLEVLDKSLEIHQGDLRLLSIPTVNWMWPEERVRIDRAYPDVTGDDPAFTFPDGWWQNHNTCVYGDGIKCSSAIYSGYLEAE
jgi:LruC domain-containing protein